MNIKDYLKYYIGCDVIVDGEHRGKFIGADLVPNSVDQIYYTIEIDGEDEDSLNAPYNDDSSEDCRLQPILRRMSSMTDDQLINLATIYSGADRITRTKGIANNWFYFFCGFKKSNGGGVNETLVIDDKGEAWYEHYFDPKAKRGRGHNVINQAGAFHYLLSIGIDLFGLIDAGLAIDAATINQQTEGK